MTMRAYSDDISRAPFEHAVLGNVTKELIIRICYRWWLYSSMHIMTGSLYKAGRDSSPADPYLLLNKHNYNNACSECVHVVTIDIPI